MLLTKLISQRPPECGLAMDPDVRAEVERQLTADLNHYKVGHELSFDWSQSFGMGKHASLPQGKIQNFSRIIVFDKAGDLVADGCMDFICNKFLCVIYWDLVSVWKNGRIVREKKVQGIPVHIWRNLPVAMMTKYVKAFS